MPRLCQVTHLGCTPNHPLQASIDLMQVVLQLIELALPCRRPATSLVPQLAAEAPPLGVWHLFDLFTTHRLFPGERGAPAVAAPAAALPTPTSRALLAFP